MSSSNSDPNGIESPKTNEIRNRYSLHLKHGWEGVHRRHEPRFNERISSKTEYPTFDGHPNRLTPIEAHFFERMESDCSETPASQVQESGRDIFSGICHLYIEIGDGATAGGTGWLVSPRCVITAGHCVHMGEDGRFFERITITAGRNGTKIRPFDDIEVESKHFRASRGWTERGRLAQDYGAIILPSPFPDSPAGDRPMVLSLAEPGRLPKKGEEVLVSGYPTKKRYGTQWKSTDSVVHVGTERVFYNVSTSEGTSGGPVLFAKDKTIIGIHNYGGCPNKGTIITEAVRQDICSWMRESEA